MHVETARECFHEGVQVAAEHYGCFCSQEPHPHCCLSRYSHQCPGSLGSGKPPASSRLKKTHWTFQFFQHFLFSEWKWCHSRAWRDRVETTLCLLHFQSLNFWLYATYLILIINSQRKHLKASSKHLKTVSSVKKRIWKPRYLSAGLFAVLLVFASRTL